MKLCFPVRSDEGIESLVNDHFGSTPLFLIVDTDTGGIEMVNNGNLHHGHGMCQPLKALGGQKIDAIVVGGLGLGTLQKLSAMGVEVYRAAASSVKVNMELFGQGRLAKITPDNACAGHGSCDDEENENDKI